VNVLRARFQRWWQARIHLTDTTLLTQRNVYILPTVPGLVLAATLLVLLVASINYQLNLGYLLTFLLAGCAMVGMHVGHATLRGLTMHLIAPSAQYMGASALLDIQLSSRSKTTRHGIGLGLLGSGHWAWTDVPAQGSAQVQIAFSPSARGLQTLPAITAETRFPLGTFRIWTTWRPAAQLLVYPRPEGPPPPLPPGQPRAGGTRHSTAQATDAFDSVRAYRRGDPLKLVVWKKAAQTGVLVSRTHQPPQQPQRHELWLDYAQAGLPNQEARLSRLCAWVLQADQQGLDFGLRLPGSEIAPATGAAHKRRCLEALALC
jgi:uncharacterized protein (DUF58 family)